MGGNFSSEHLKGHVEGANVKQKNKKKSGWFARLFCGSNTAAD